MKTVAIIQAEIERFLSNCILNHCTVSSSV